MAPRICNTEIPLALRFAAVPPPILNSAFLAWKAGAIDILFNKETGILVLSRQEAPVTPGELAQVLHFLNIDSKEMVFFVTASPAPVTCVACSGTGRASTGGSCFPCNGIGKLARKR